MSLDVNAPDLIIILVIVVVLRIQESHPALPVYALRYKDIDSLGIIAVN